MNCSNCSSPALWIYDVEGTAPVAYCDAHLPGFMRPMARAGMLATTDAYTAVEESVAATLAPEPEVAEEAPAPKRARKKAEPAPVEEPAAEEAPAEETVED